MHTMSKPLRELLSLLQLEKLEEGLFRGQSENLGLPQVYGGQVIGQALSELIRKLIHVKKL